MNEPLAFCTFLLILATVVVSYRGFQDPSLEAKLIFNPECILAGKQYYRLVTSAFLHSGWNHLIWNMVSLYLFGGLLERSLGTADFLLIYFGAVVGGSLLSLYVHRHHDYTAYGASGGVCGLIFAYLLLFPGAGIGLYFIVPLPGWLYAIGFLVGSFLAMKTHQGNVGHDAHLGGAIIGFLIAAALRPEAARYNGRMFLLILVPAILLLIYLWCNPLFLPVETFLQRKVRSRNRQRELPQYKQQALRLDAILEKISRHGVDSLTSEDKAILEEASAQSRRRAESEKPKSGLAI
jgi:membrane associated rhomboid family serine protease